LSQQQPQQATNPKQLENDYSYSPDDENNVTNEKSNSTNNQQQDLYSPGIKDLAQSKVFEVQFMDGTKKIYRRRKAGLGEIGEYTEKQQTLYNMNSQTNPRQANNNLIDFYHYAATIFLIETKNNAKMTRDEIKEVVFEDFKRIISACEYASIFNPN